MLLARGLYRLGYHAAREMGILPLYPVVERVYREEKIAKLVVKARVCVRAFRGGCVGVCLCFGWVVCMVGLSTCTHTPIRPSHSPKTHNPKTNTNTNTNRASGSSRK